MENIIKLLNNAVGWSILHSLWQAATVYIILTALFLFSHKMSSNTKYKLAYAAQILVFGSFIYTLFQYFKTPLLINEDIANSEKDKFILYLHSLHSKSWSITQLFPYIVALYSLGIIIQLFLCSKSIQLLHCIKKSGTSLFPVGWSETFEKIKYQHKVTSNTTLLVSEYISDPITIGFIRPLIIFPVAYINKISVEHVEAILLHEIAHIKRNDYFFNLILITIETVLFFNPFVWLISKYIKLERELSCDDFVTKFVKSPISYARTLLQIELIRQEITPKMAMALSGNNQNNLLNRIKRINNQIMESKRTHFKHQLMAMFLTSVTFLFIGWINPSDIKKTMDNKTSIKASVKKTEAISTSKDTTKNEKSIVKKKVIIKTDSSEIILNDDKEIDKYFDSPERKKQLEEIQEYSKKMEMEINSTEWKDRISKLELNSKEVENLINSPEWKAKIAEIEKNAKNIDLNFNSAEWEDKIAKLDLGTKKLEDFFTSAEWKDKIAQIELNAKKIEEHFNSPEWKAKIEKIENLYNSDEFKEINSRYQKEIENLKKQKGVK